MLENILNPELYNAISQIPYQKLNELRLRANNPVVVSVMGENYYLCNHSLSKSSRDAIIVSAGVINGILLKISNNSMYTINDQLIDGYVTIKGGVRVGVCGEVVSVDNKIKTVKNISSLNFRFPHLIKNCSINVLSYILQNNNIHNTLIISPPGAGKTTYLRDLIYQLTKKRELLNILVVDERQEIVDVYNGIDNTHLDFVDVYSNSSKRFALNNGIRSMRPDVIITDEINIDKDLIDIENAMTSGVKVIATIHASSIFDLKFKTPFKELLNKKLFTRFVVLSTANGVGTLDGVYDENLNFLGV